MMDTNHHTTKSTSSQPMEDLEIRQRILRLGKILVKELRLESETDTLARWMAHYIAEQLVIAKTARGDAKSKAEKECCEIILKLWQHRADFPKGKRPFESFEPIFRALERLDPDNTTPYFYAQQNTSRQVSGDKNSEDVQKWLNLASGIDQAARIWLEYAFQQAAISATDQNTLTWLEHALELPDNDDASLIAHMIEVGYEKKEEDSADFITKAKEKQLKARIRQLDTFNEINQVIRAAFVAELKTMIDDDHSADGDE